MEIKAYSSPLVKLNARYWLAEHPIIAHFRWDHNAWGSSWLFLLASVSAYIFSIFFLKLVLLIFKKKSVNLGSIPGIYNLALLVIRVAIFVGCLVATAVEIKETRWIWRKSMSSAEWLVCFPLGTRSAGRVFFWSYLFYLTKYCEFMTTFIRILSEEPVGFVHIFDHLTRVFVCFFWLEFSQSLQVLGILTSTLMKAIVCSWEFWRPAYRPKLAAMCQLGEFVIMVAGSFWMLRLHFTREGCNGMASWVFNASAYSLLFLILWNSSLKQHFKAPTKFNQSVQQSKAKQKLKD
jgi:hypothetical protein